MDVSHPSNFTRLTVDNHQRTYSTLGGSLLILALLLSPFLRNLFSHRYLVFLGGISYALYLLHATLIRSLLSYLIYSIPRSSEQLVAVVNEQGEHIRTITMVIQVSRVWAVVRSFAFAAWLVGLVLLAHVWTKKVDGFSLSFAKWLEEVVSGKRGVFERIGGVRMGFPRDNGNGEIAIRGEVDLEKEGKD